MARGRSGYFPARHIRLPRRPSHAPQATSSPLSGLSQPQHLASPTNPLTKKGVFLLYKLTLLGCQYSHTMECKNHKSGYFRAFPRLPRCTTASLKAPLTVATCFFHQGSAPSHCQNLFLTTCSRSLTSTTHVTVFFSRITSVHCPPLPWKKTSLSSRCQKNIFEKYLKT